MILNYNKQMQPKSKKNQRKLKKKLRWMASFWQLQLNDEKLKGDTSTLV